ncbi:hypothetical protein DFH08DRAFT_970010 [Mycena albidolilacea]|uniref:Uncharacterized protein n=1 Tax=Mycena albidolilacea TaxID=1033008 RepID=A0AAD6ZHJ6_9AGAR|nr:hypothetical protein DFH08DRAFT_970010 [Mycena albidolilacea]
MCNTLHILATEDVGAGGGNPPHLLQAIQPMVQESGDEDENEDGGTKKWPLHSDQGPPSLSLASLVSLAKWVVTNKNTPTKKHRPTSNIIMRGLKSLVPIAASSSSGAPESSSSYQPLLTLKLSLNGGGSGSSSQRLLLAVPVRQPPRTNSDESSWEMVDDLPLQWTWDFVSLVSAGLRLVNASVLSFALWTCPPAGLELPPPYTPEAAPQRTSATTTMVGGVTLAFNVPINSNIIGVTPVTQTVNFGRDVPFAVGYTKICNYVCWVQVG